MTLNTKSAQAVLLTVPPFPVRPELLHGWLSVRRPMTENRFRQVLSFLFRSGLVRRLRTGEYQLATP